MSSQNIMMQLIFVISFFVFGSCSIPGELDLPIDEFINLFKSGTPLESVIETVILYTPFFSFPFLFVVFFFF